MLDPYHAFSLTTLYSLSTLLHHLSTPYLPPPYSSLLPLYSLSPPHHIIKMLNPYHPFSLSLNLNQFELFSVDKRLDNLLKCKVHLDEVNLDNADIESYKTNTERESQRESESV